MGHMITGRDDIAAAIERVLDDDGTALLHVTAYRIGDKFEVPCVASALTVSREHLAGVEFDDTGFSAAAWFPPELVPDRYRSRVSDTGVVKVAIRAEWDDVTGLIMT